jgi:glycosyltransferase involved in cell wall biosynthesis
MILFDARWIGDHGIGRFAREVIARLPEVEAVRGSIAPLSPLDPLYTSWIIRKNKPAVFYSPGYNPPLYSISPFVFTIYDLIQINLPSNKSLMKSTYFKYIVRPACHRAFKILTTSEFSRTSIINWSHVSPDKVINVSCGVSDEYHPEGPRYEPGYPYLLYVGNRKPHKNLPGLFEAFRLSGINSKIKLILSGDPDRETVNLIRENKLQNSVVFAGIIPERMLPRYYRGAEALVLPSQYEGFGLPVLEAMACGTPVVTSNSTSLPEVAGPATLLIDPDKSDEIAGAIHRVVNDSSLRERMRKLGIEQAKKFSWDKTADSVKSVLEEAQQNRNKH